MADEPREEDGRADAGERRAGGNRRSGDDRRTGVDRRQRDVPVPAERRAGRDRRTPQPEAERRKVERRINEYVLEPDVLEFINAVNAYKTRHQRPFPTWSEIHKIFVGLGYRKVPPEA